MITYLKLNLISFDNIKTYCSWWLRGSTSCSTKTKPRSSKRPKRPTALCSFYLNSLLCSSLAISGSAVFEGLRILVPQLEAESLEAAVTVRENLRSLTLSAYTEKIDREERKKTLVYLLYLESLCYNVSVSSEKRRNECEWRSY